jgi:hypothetical protein
MVARQAVDTVTPVPVSGRRYRRKEKYTRQTMRRAALYGSAAIAALLAYTVPFALASKEGYEQNKIRAEIQELSQRNEELQTQLASLKNPRMLDAYAVKQGMIPRDKPRFVSLPDAPKAAPKRSLFARLASLSFR